MYRGVLCKKYCISIKGKIILTGLRLLTPHCMLKNSSDSGIRQDCTRLEKRVPKVIIACILYSSQVVIRDYAYMPVPCYALFLFRNIVSKQSRKHCFLVMFPKGGQTKKTLFPSHVSRRWTNQETLFPSHVSRRSTNQETLFPIAIVYCLVIARIC